MSEALSALDVSNVEVLVITSSSYRQNFCFLVRQSELGRALEQLEATFGARTCSRVYEADPGGFQRRAS